MEASVGKAVPPCEHNSWVGMPVFYVMQMIGCPNETIRVAMEENNVPEHVREANIIVDLGKSVGTQTDENIGVQTVTRTHENIGVQTVPRTQTLSVVKEILTHPQTVALVSACLCISAWVCHSVLVPTGPALIAGIM